MLKNFVFSHFLLWEWTKSGKLLGLSSPRKPIGSPNFPLGEVTALLGESLAGLYQKAQLKLLHGV